MTYTALIVEDNKQAAELHAEMLQELDVASVHVPSPEDAIQKMLNLPSFDIVLSDLDFSDGGAQNTKGDQVADWLRKFHYPAVSALCSAQIAENSKKYQVSRKKFDVALSHNAVIDDYRSLVQRAEKNKILRVERSNLFVEPKLASQYRNALKKIHSLVDSTDLDPNSGYFKTGHRIICAQPVVETFPVGSPIFLWQKSIPEGVYLEVYGQPLLFSFGLDLDKALLTLNEVLISTFQELQNQRVSPRLEVVKKFVEALYFDGFLGEME